jgi:hypothetical protein
MKEQIAFHDIPLRASAYQSTRQPAVQAEYEVEEDDSYYSQRLPTSTRRYDRGQDQEVITQGNRRIVIHRAPPPQEKRHMHWLVWVGIGMLVMIAGWILFSSASTWWTNQQNTWSYGLPRTYQIDQVVGHADSVAHPSHFIALNLNGHIDVIELPGGDATHARIYTGPELFGVDAMLTPVTLSFKDMNGDGKPDLLLHVQDQTIVFLNDGTQFKTPK